MTSFATNLTFVVVLLVTLSSCNDSAGFSGNNTKKKASGETTTTNSSSVTRGEALTQEIEYKASMTAGNNKVDLIFAIDSSRSMRSENEFLGGHIDSFVSRMKSDTDLDYQVFVLGTSITITTNDRVEVMKQEIGSNDSLNILKSFLQTKGLGSLQVRQDAIKEIVVISDNNANVSAYDFEQFLRQNFNNFGLVRVNAFVGLPSSAPNDWCQISAPGNVYKDLASSKLVGGFVQDICDGNWGRLFQNLGVAPERIAQGGASLLLNAKPDLNQPVEVKVNDNLVATGAWTYDQTLNAVIISDVSSLQDGAKISVKYYPL